MINQNDQGMATENRWLYLENREGGNNWPKRYHTLNLYSHNCTDCTVLNRNSNYANGLFGTSTTLYKYFPRNIKNYVQNRYVHFAQQKNRLCVKVKFTRD